MSQETYISALYRDFNGEFALTTPGFGAVWLYECYSVPRDYIQLGSEWQGFINQTASKENDRRSRGRLPRFRYLLLRPPLLPQQHR